MRDRYEGVCYDGPHEGQSYSYPTPYFRVALFEPKETFRWEGWAAELPTAADFRTGDYRWSNALRKWVWTL
jgi:hypothetical protein